MAKTDIPGVVSESGILPVMGPEELQRRRAIAVALASKAQRPFPKTIGEGLTSLGEAYGDVMSDRRLTEAERAMEARRQGQLAGVPAETSPAVAPVIRPPGSNPAAGAVAAPRPVAAIPAVEPGSDPRARIAAIANPNDPALRPAGVASPDPTLAGATEPPQTSLASSAATPEGGGDDPVWAARQGAIGGIESRGQPDPYQAVGAPTKYGRGLGRYQVVEANIAPWTQAALGQALTPQQYLASPQAQDAVFKHRFGQYVDQFGEEGAARAWFGGPGNVNKGDLTDVHKRLSIADYGKSYMAGLQAGTDPTRVAAYAPTGTATDAPPVGARGGAAISPLTEENPVTPSDIMPAPTMVAEARGVAPGAAPAPLKAYVAPKQGEIPLPERTPETPREAYARRMYLQNMNDPYSAPMWKSIVDDAEAKRKFIDDRNIEVWKTEVAKRGALDKTREEQLATEQERQLKLDAETLKNKQAQEETRGFGYVGGRGDAEKLLVESKKGVEHTPGAAYAIQQASQLLASDKTMFTGSLANVNLSWAKLLTAFGVKPPDPAIINTEKFKPYLADVLAQLRPAIVGPGTQSNNEFKILERAAAGDITLEPGSIRGILESIYKRNLRDAMQHQEKYQQYEQRIPEATRGMAAATLGLPIERIVPPDKVAMLRKNLEGITDPAKRAAEIKEFEDDYVPGVARMLGIK